MEKTKYQIEFGKIKEVISAINPQEAFIIVVRKNKYPPMPLLFRFRKEGKRNYKDKETLWNYQDSIEVLKNYGLLAN
jgi:hypothetical protein